MQVLTDQARVHRPAVAASCIALTLLLMSTSAAKAESAGNSGGLKGIWHSPYNSWAIGIVVPDGAKLQGGGAVSWDSVTNLTALAKLPNITNPDAITYIVLSAMGSDKTVFQVAAGAWPASNRWSVYSWFIEGVDTTSPTYNWVANSTGPGLAPGDLLSISIFLRSSAEWMYKVDDVNTTASGGGSFPSARAAAFESGDQEVFAFESYSRSASTFEDMGNLTLESLSINGARVQGGWYSYSGWDPAHNPLFVVGAASPPPFIFYSAAPGGEAVWTFASLWTNAQPGPGLGLTITGWIVLSVGVASLLVLSRTRRFGGTRKLRSGDAVFVRRGQGSPGSWQAF